MSFGPCKRTALLGILVGAASLGTTRVIASEADDLARQIDVHRTDANDMEQLDKRRNAIADLTLLRMWLDDAWDLRSKKQFVAVREVLDRVDAQATLIRQEIKLEDMLAEATKREDLVRANRLKSEQKRQQLTSIVAQIKVAKLALEGHAVDGAHNDGGLPNEHTDGGVGN